MGGSHTHSLSHSFPSLPEPGCTHGPNGPCGGAACAAASVCVPRSGRRQLGLLRMREPGMATHGEQHRPVGVTMPGAQTLHASSDERQHVTMLHEACTTLKSCSMILRAAMAGAVAQQGIRARVHSVHGRPACSMAAESAGCTSNGDNRRRAVHLHVEREC